MGHGGSNYIRNYHLHKPKRYFAAGFTSFRGNPTPSGCLCSCAALWNSSSVQMTTVLPRSATTRLFSLSPPYAKAVTI